MAEPSPSPPSRPSSEPELPLFPLDLVLFPDGLLELRIFEPRYLDMVSACWRSGSRFGVVALIAGGEVRTGAAGPVRFESIGSFAAIDSLDAERAGLLRIACHATGRFELGTSRQRADGLWLGSVRALAADPNRTPPAATAGTVRALATTMATLKGQLGANGPRFPSPYRFDDAGWVANRWCELLPLATSAKQKLMAERDPQARLERVDRFLRRQGVVADDDPVA